MLKHRPTTSLGVCALRACALLLLAPLASAQHGSSAVRLDGQIGDEEWADASRHDLVGGGELLLMRDDDVYAAVRGEDFGWAHLYVPRGDTLFVLHASAALGTAVYVRDTADRWTRSAAFEWGVRDTTFSPHAEAERTAFFAEHGWVANTNMMGTRRVIEFRISTSLLRPSGARLAALFASDPAHPQYWPEGLTDATLDAELIRGTPPARLRFEPARWALLDGLVE